MILHPQDILLAGDFKIPIAKRQQYNSKFKTFGFVDSIQSKFLNIVRHLYFDLSDSLLPFIQKHPNVRTILQLKFFNLLDEAQQIRPLARFLSEAGLRNHGFEKEGKLLYPRLSQKIRIQCIIVIPFTTWQKIIPVLYI